MGRIGLTEIIFGAGILFVFFGAKRIPLIARGIGEGIRNFKTSFRDPERIEGQKGPEEGSRGEGRDGRG